MVRMHKNAFGEISPAFELCFLRKYCLCWLVVLFYGEFVECTDNDTGASGKKKAVSLHPFFLFFSSRSRLCERVGSLLVKYVAGTTGV